MRLVSRAWRVGVLIVLVAAVGQVFSRPSTRLRLATTTSTDNSGLLDYLLPVFESECSCKVDVIAVGTGKALRLGMNGDVDVVLVHDRKREEAFVAHGFGLSRREVMVNDFVVVGPPTDPAEVRSTRTLDEALRKIAASTSGFLSRGDESGTHSRERELWANVSIVPSGTWYRETGLGMGATLQVASETGGYTLTDRGTYLAMRDQLDLTIVSEGDPRLLNSYGVIPVRIPGGAEEPRALAERFAAWLLSPEVQERIGAYRRDGEILFHPVAGVSEPNEIEHSRFQLPAPRSSVDAREGGGL